MRVMTPLDADNRRMGLYVMGHHVRLAAIVRVVTTHHMVINHDTTLYITSLQIFHMLLMPILGMHPPRPLLAQHRSPNEGARQHGLGRDE
jgi:hypothetical protein